MLCSKFNFIWKWLDTGTSKEVAKIAKLTIEPTFPMLSEVRFHTIPSIIRSRLYVPSKIQLPFFECTWSHTGHYTCDQIPFFCLRDIDCKTSCLQHCKKKHSQNFKSSLLYLFGPICRNMKSVLNATQTQQASVHVCTEK